MAYEEGLPIKIPDVLFQYCGGNVVEIFEKRRIKSSIPSTLNDPFEFNPSVDEYVTPEQIWNTMTKLHRKSPLPKPPTRLVVAKMKAMFQTQHNAIKLSLELILSSTRA